MSKHTEDSKKQKKEEEQRFNFNKIYFIALHLIILFLLIQLGFSSELSKENIEKVAYRYAVEDCLEKTEDLEGEFKCNNINLTAKTECSCFCIDNFWNVEYASSDKYANGRTVTGLVQISVKGNPLAE